MNRNLKKGLILAAAGFGAGMLVSLVVLRLADPEALAGGYSAGKLILFLLAGGLNGAVCMGFSAVYDVERWSVTRATVTHFAITMCSLWSLALVQGWFPETAASFLVVQACFTAAYFVIWLAMYLSWRREVRRMNLELEEWKASHAGDDPPEPRE